MSRRDDTEEFGNEERSGSDPGDTQEMRPEQAGEPGARASGAGAGDPTRLEEIPPVPDEETAAAAWAAGGTPSSDQIPDLDEAERTEAERPTDAGVVSGSQAGSEGTESEPAAEPYRPAEIDERDPLGLGDTSGMDVDVTPSETPTYPTAGSGALVDKDPVFEAGPPLEPYGGPAAGEQERSQGAEPSGPEAPAAVAAGAAGFPFDPYEAPAPEPSPDALITEKGETIIAPSVVEKIAGKAASEVEGVKGVQSSGLSRITSLLSGGDDRQTEARASVERASTGVSLSVSIEYPLPVGQVSDRVRQHVRARIQELTGLQVTGVDLTVPELVAPEPRPRPRVE